MFIFLIAVNLHKNFCCLVCGKHLLNEVKIGLFSLETLAYKVCEVVIGVEIILISEPVLCLVAAGGFGGF